MVNEIIYFVGSWSAVARVIVVGTLAYFSLVLLIRMSTKRSLAQLSAFDFVITVALGSSFGRILTATEVGMVEAVVAFGLLVSLQYLMAAAEMRWPWFARVAKAPPALIYYRGEFQKGGMRKEHISEREIQAAVRKAGLGSLEQVEAVIMEAGGDFSIVEKTLRGDGSALRPSMGSSTK